jgi:excisionase family DNA binding protein
MSRSGTSDSQPVFMRLPAAAAEQLDQIARARGATKREIVTRLILDNDLPVGHHAFHPTPEPAVLTPRQAAELLQIDERLVLDLAAAHRLPGRLVGETWRFSRRALLEWLESPNEADVPPQRGTR